MSYDSRYQPRGGKSGPPSRDYHNRDRGRDRERDRDYDRNHDYGYDRDRDHNRDRDRDRNRDRDRDYHSSLPPRPPSRSGRAPSPDSYRPNQNDRQDPRDRDYARRDSRPSRNGPSHPPPPPPRHPQPPPPLQPPQGDFTFSVEKPPGIDSSSYDSYRPNEGSSYRDRRPGKNFKRNARGGRGGGGFGSLRFLAANRPILRNTHSTGPEQAFYDADAGATYRLLDEPSDSGEADMDISGDESGASDGGSGSHEPSTKRTRISVQQSASDNNAPKWSNPDPYTALPPPDATQQKKKDVVQLIRNARVQTREQKASVPADAAEFISCDFDDSDSGSDGGVKDSSKPANAPGVLGAPTGPRMPNIPRLAGQDTKSNDARPANLPEKPHHNTAATAPTLATQPGTKQRKLAAAEDIGTSSLGSRKRTHDDRIILPAHSRLKKANKMPVRGSLVWDWEIKDGEDPCPWLVADHSGSASMGVWLHKEIMDFYDYVRPQDYEQRIRQELIQQLKAFCRSTYRDAEVYPFGSFPSGLYLPTGDMDLVLCSDSYLKGGRAKYSTKSALFKLRTFLHHNRVAHMNEFELILHAKVPLVKYIDRRTGLKMDVSFENLTGLQAIDTFMAWKEQYAAMPILVTLVKHFLFMRGLNEPVNGGIGGFSVICLVVSMLQMMPEVQSRNMNTAHHLGDLLLEFFDLYGNRFNYRTTAISLNPPKYISKNAVTAFAYKHQDRLSIIDPNNPGNDIAGGSSNTPTILGLFSEAHRLLSNKMVAVAQSPDKRNASILEVIFAGNYSTFRNQRAHLLKLSQGGSASADPTPETVHVEW